MAEASTPRLRVAVLNRVFRSSGGGAETYSIHLVQQLAGRHDIHVFAQEFGHDWPGVVHEQVPCLFRRPRWLNQLWYALYTWRATRTGFDVVHSHENTWHGDIQSIHVRPVRGDLLGAARGWPRVGRWARIALSPRLLSNLALEALRFRPRVGRRIVLASDALRVQCVDSYPRSQHMMSVVTPGVHMEPAHASPREARALLGLPLDADLVLFVANDFARKGLATLLDAVAGLDAGTTLAVVGGGSGEPYGDRVRSLGLQDRVRFLGARQDMALLYRAATVLAHPTLGDTFAMVVLEAMAHGLPVVVSGPSHCGISSMLRDGEDAVLLHDPRDERELGDALRRVLGHQETAASLRAKGKRFASLFTWEETARKYEALYRAAAVRPG